MSVLLDIDSSVLVILVASLAVDLIIGEWPAKIHPTVWIGNIISKISKPLPRTGSRSVICGIILALCLPTAILISTWVLLVYLKSLNQWIYILVSIYFLKSSFSLRLLGATSLKISNTIKSSGLERSRKDLKALVSRDPSQLTEQQVLAATIESVSENTSDSVIAPLLMFAIFGVAGALAYRSINTLDSMIGYRGEFELLGKGSAKLDDIVNWIPSRLSGVLIVLSSIFLPAQKFLPSLSIMLKHHKKTESPNAGWPMAAMAGALEIELTKPGHYSLGKAKHPISHNDIRNSVKSLYSSSVIFVLIISVIIVSRVY